MKQRRRTNPLKNLVDTGNVRSRGVRPYRCDIRKLLKAACARAGIRGLRIHDLRHLATSILFMNGVPEAAIRKITGHRSKAIERYEHVSVEFRRMTVEMMERGYEAPAQKPAPLAGATDERGEVAEKLGGDDGVRTRDLRRDRPAF